MATIRIEIGKKNRNGAMPVSFLVCHKGGKKRIPAGISLGERDVSPDGRRIRSAAKARKLEQRRYELQESMDRMLLDMGHDRVDVSFIVSHLSADEVEHDFFSFAEDWVEHSRIRGTKNYLSMLRSLEKYLGCRELPFWRVTFQLLRGFEEYLDGKERAQSLYLGEMRHLWREAMRTLNTDYETVIPNDPFMRYRCPKQRMRRSVRSLTLEQLLAVMRYRGSGRAQLARDCFVLSFCLMGMNSADLYSCKVMRGDTLCYHRAKTMDRRSDGAYIEVRVHPLLAELVDKYRGKDRVFNFYERYGCQESFNQNLNKGLKDVGRSVGIDRLCFYSARHTFATLSRNMMRFSKSDVDEALNHVGQHEMADVYIARDFSIINDNNALLVERVMGMV